MTLATAAHAQESGGSFGGSSWDEPAGGGGGGGGGSFGGGGSSPSYDDSAQRAEQARQEAARAAEEQRRADEERARIAREEAAAAAAAAAERARILALAPAARVHEVTWPAAPAFPAIASPEIAPIDRELPSTSDRSASWTPSLGPPIEAAATVIEGPWNVFAAVPCGGALTLLLLMGAGLLMLRGRPSQLGPSFVAARPISPSSGSAMRISLAFDWTARAQLQASLAEMAKRSDMRTRAGLDTASGQLAQLLTSHADAVRYVTWELSTGDARSWFQTRTNDLRARYRAELVRNDATTEGRTFEAHENEGAGLVIVSVIVAGKQPISAPRAAFDVAALRDAIRRIRERPANQTLALEVVWSPAAENDRMSSYELEKLYPELQRIREGVGAQQCLYCKGPFPAELGMCPNCGAPNR